MLRVSPTEASSRLIASTIYQQLGEESEAIAQLGIAIALDPENFAFYKRMALHLMRRGEVQAAKAMLEKGWLFYRKLLAKKDLEATREEYFTLPDQKKAA